MPSDRQLDKIVNKENRHYDNVIKDLFRSPHVIARIIQTAIPEFFDWSIEDIINILPTEGKQVHFDMQSSSDSDYKSVIGDLKFTIEKIESIKNIKNGAKIGLEVQTSKLTSFADKARKNQYIAQQISEQQVDYKKLKESYLIWIFINPRHHFKDKILFSDFSSVRYEGHIRDGEIEFELVDKEKYKSVLNKNEFLDIRTESLMHEVEIYISENNTSNLDLFQFLSTADRLNNKLDPQ